MSQIACYCRVSTRQQKNDSQRAEIQRWLRNHEFAKSKIIWFEDKESSTKLQRTAFDQMCRGIFDGTIKTVVVWKLDRISRRQRDGINVLADGVREVYESFQSLSKLISAVRLGEWLPA